MSSDEETDLNVTVESNDGSLYVPTPQRKVKEYVKNMSIIPSNVCFMDLNQLDKFIKQVNQIRCCATPGCKGALRPINVKSLGLGGAVSITYACNGCAGQWAFFETSSKYELGATTEIGIAAQVAFIIAGCTHITYFNRLYAIDAITRRACAAPLTRFRGSCNHSSYTRDNSPKEGPFFSALARILGLLSR